MNKRAFSEIFQSLCEMYSTTASLVLTYMYYDAVKVLSEDQFRDAVKKIVAVRKEPDLPRPAEILEQALGSNDDKAIFALQSVEKAIARYGVYESVIFSDPVIHAAIETASCEGYGGWPALGAMQVDDFKFWRKDFLKLYKVHALHPPQKPVKLRGIHEINNLDSREPIFIYCKKP